jgi:hypothetical protein
MSFVVVLGALEVLTYEQAQQRENDAASGVILAFSEEGLNGSAYAMLHTSDMPLPDHRYWRAELGAVQQLDGKFYADWQVVPVLEAISVLAERKLQEVNTFCVDAIKQGFGSLALGSLYHYSCDQESQMNIQGNVMVSSRGRDVRHICYTPAMERVVIAHTPAQMEKVGEDMSDHIWRQLDRANNLRSLINGFVAAGDVEGLIAVNWESLAA